MQFLKNVSYKQNTLYHNIVQEINSRKETIQKLIYQQTNLYHFRVHIAILPTASYFFDNETMWAKCNDPAIKQLEGVFPYCILIKVLLSSQLRVNMIFVWFGNYCFLPFPISWAVINTDTARSFGIPCCARAATSSIQTVPGCPRKKLIYTVMDNNELISDIVAAVLIHQARLRLLNLIMFAVFVMFF